MSFLDFTPVRRQLDPGDLFDPVLATLAQRAKVRAEEERQARELQFRREQEQRLSARDDDRFKVSEARQKSIDDREQRRFDQSEKQRIGKATLENQRNRKQAEKDIMAGIAAEGADSPTAQRLSDYQEQDPETGEVRSTRLFERIHGVEPTVPPPAMDSPEVGPQISREDAERADITRIGQYQDDLAEFQEGQTDPRVRVGDVKTSVGDLRYSQGRQNAQDFEGQRKIIEARMKGNTDPVMQMVFERQLERLDQLAQGVGTGGIPLKQALESVEKAGIRDDKELFANAQGDKRDARAIRVAEIGAQGRTSTRDLQEKRFGFQEQKERSNNLRKDVTADLTSWNAKTTQDAAIQWPNIITKLKSGNGKLQQEALITMMRISQADNRFSDKDAELALRSGVGWIGGAENFVNRGINGDLGDEVISVATKAAETLSGMFKEKLDAMHENFYEYLNNPNQYDAAEAEQLLRRRIPSMGAYIDARRAKDGGTRPGSATNPPPANVAPSGGDQVRVMPGKLPGAAEAAASPVGGGGDEDDDEEMEIDATDEQIMRAIQRKEAAAARRGRR